jgi:putative serine protease PepD
VTDSTNFPREEDPDIRRSEAHEDRSGTEATRPVPSSDEATAPFYRTDGDEPHRAWAAPGSTPVATAEAAPATETAETAAGDGSGFRRQRRNGLLLPVAAAAVIAALVGGGVGAGIGVAASQHDDLATTTTSNGNNTSSNITINNTKTATTISAVAAKASPSVVTIAVDASNESGTGSGIVLTSDGYVLTNDHVVTLEGASSSGSISVTTSNGRIYSAKTVGMDPLNDLAVIKLDNASGLTPAQWADSSKLNVGDTAIAIGAPLGLSGTVTNGIVSALNRSISVASSAVPKTPSDNGNDNGNGQNGPFNFWDFGDGNGNGNQSTATSSVSLAVIQTDAAINPGNSGGALLNAQGQVIGVNVAIASAGSGSSGGQSGNIGVGFAIPSNIAQRIAAELRTNKAATHGLLGATVGDADASTKSTVAGARIQSVTSGGAAAAAGVKAGDVVTNFNGVPIGSATDLTAQVRALPGGASAKLTYVRGGNPTTVTVKLGTYKG